VPSVTIRPTPARWHCSVRAVKDAFRQDIKSGSDQRNLAPMFDQRPNRQQNHTFLGWEKAARAHATAASGTGYSILHEDRGEARKRWRNRCAHRALVFRTSAFSVNVRFAPEAANQEWHWVRSWRIFSSLPLSPLSSKPLGKSCWRPGKEPIGGTDRPEDLSEQSFDCDPPDRQSETSLADLDAR